MTYTSISHTTFFIQVFHYNSVSPCYRYRTEAEKNLLDKTTFLDPRVKSLKHLSAAEREIIHDLVLDECVGMCSQQQTEVTPPVRNNAVNDSDSSDNHGLASLLSMYAEDDDSESTGTSVSDIRLSPWRLTYIKQRRVPRLPAAL